MLSRVLLSFFFFFFNDTATTEIYTLSLHDALPISTTRSGSATCRTTVIASATSKLPFSNGRDRKSTRLNSSHGYISYAVFCLKKKKRINITDCRERSSTHRTLKANHQCTHYRAGST